LTRWRTSAAWASALGGSRRPDQAAAPVVDHVAAGVPRKLLTDVRRGSRRRGDPPHRPGASGAIAANGLRGTPAAT